MSSCFLFAILSADLEDRNSKRLDGVKLPLLVEELPTAVDFGVLEVEEKVDGALADTGVLVAPNCMLLLLAVERLLVFSVCLRGVDIIPLTAVPVAFLAE